METKLTTAQHTERYRLCINDDKNNCVYTSGWHENKAEVIELSKKQAEKYPSPNIMYIEKEMYIVSYEKI